jgi:hypothetical protein
MDSDSNFLIEFHFPRPESNYFPPNLPVDFLTRNEKAPQEPRDIGGVFDFGKLRAGGFLIPKAVTARDLFR